MFNQFIVIFTIYYIIIIIHVFQHIYYYELFFEVYQPKLVRFFISQSYTTVNLVEVFSYFRKMAPKSHVRELMNFEGLPEVFQHARTAAENPKDYYHVSAANQGYDAFSLNPDNLEKIMTEQNTGLMTFYEYKMMKNANRVKIQIPHLFKKYSAPKGGCEDDLGFRPDSVDLLQIGMLPKEEFNKAVETVDLSTFKNPIITLEDYSNFCPKLVLHEKRGGFGHGTLLSDSAFENLKWFFYSLEKNEEMCLYMNYLLTNNPNFPLYYM